MNDRVVGSLILVGSLCFAVFYAWLLMFSAWSYIGLVATALLAVLGVSAIVAWIGYTLATTPPPKPMEAFQSEEAEADKGVAGAS